MKKHFVLTELKDKIIIKFELQDKEQTIKIYDKRTKEVKTVCNLLEVNKLNFEYSKGIITVSKEDIKEIYFDILIRLNLESHIKISLEVEKIIYSEKFQENKGVENMESLAKVYVTNLGKYNEGYLVGKWFDLPCEDFEIKFNEVLKSIGIDGVEYEEYFITDWETEINGLEIGEYTNIENLNNTLLELVNNENYSEYFLKEIKTMVECLDYNLKEALENYENHQFIILDENEWNDEKNIAYSLVDSIGDLESTLGSKVGNYFDYESFGRDLRIGGDLDRLLQEYDSQTREEIESLDDGDIGEWVVNEVYGDIEHLGKETKEQYFDYESFGRDLLIGDYTICHNTKMAVSKY